MPTMFRFVLLFVCLPALSAGQSIVLIGGEIEDSNAAVYNRIIQLAVSSESSLFRFVLVGLTLYHRPTKNRPRAAGLERKSE